MVDNKKGYTITIHVVMVILCVLCIAPFLIVVASSFTAENSLIRDGYFFWPREFSTEAYQFLLKDSSVFRAYGVSFLLTAVGTTLSVILTILLAYPLSVKSIPGRRFFNFMVFFTMLFSGGLIPSYMMWTQTFHIKNTFAAILIPGLLMNGFTIMIARSYFQSNIPQEVLESARIDGCREIGVLFRIVVPMSRPIIATIGLLAGLAYWNDWQNNLYYITDPALSSIQGLMNRMLTNAQYLKQTATMGNIGGAVAPTTALRMAVVVMCIVPILCIYPFFQKHFTKGMTIGAVKG